MAGHRTPAPSGVRPPRKSRCSPPPWCYEPHSLMYLLLATTLLVYAFNHDGGVMLYAVKTLVSRSTRSEACKLQPDGTLRGPSVPDVKYTFPEVHWEGDARFYAELPCDAASYRVVIPPALATDTMHNDCNDATIVSAFFDIGRGDFVAFKRSTKSYLRDSRGVFMTLPNRVVFFTTPDMVDDVVAMRREHGLENRTIVIGLAHGCMPAAALLNRSHEVMCSPTHRDGMWLTNHPEQLYPWYNIIMWAKIHFAVAVTALPQVAAPYYYWLDAGCHAPMCRPADHAGVCLRPWAHTNSSRLRFAAPDCMSHRVLGWGDAEWSQRKRFVLAGTVYGGGPAVFRSARALFMAKVSQLMDRDGIVDQDQLVWSLVLREHPELFEPYYTAYEWIPVYDWMTHPPVEDVQALSPWREQESSWRLSYYF